MREASHPADPAVRAHVASCAACRETYDVTLWMTRLAAEGEQMAAERDLPDPARIWWRARLLQRWEAETRATAPLDMMQRVEVLGGLMAAVVLLLTLWPELRGLSDPSSAASAAGWWPVLARMLAPSGLTPFIIIGSLLIGAMAAFTVHQLMVED